MAGDHHLTSQQWLALIPVALIERCFMAAALVVCMELVERVWQACQTMVPLPKNVQNMVATD